MGFSLRAFAVRFQTAKALSFYRPKECWNENYLIRSTCCSNGKVDQKTKKSWQSLKIRKKLLKRKHLNLQREESGEKGKEKC